MLYNYKIIIMRAMQLLRAERQPTAQLPTSHRPTIGSILSSQLLAPAVGGGLATAMLAVLIASALLRKGHASPNRPGPGMEKHKENGRTRAAEGYPVDV